MNKRRLTILIVVIVALTTVGTALAATIDPVTRTVTTPTLVVDFNATNPEQIDFLSWNGSPNLTNTGATSCIGSGPLEYFGSSWASPDSIDFKSLVGWGQSGTWTAGRNAVTVNSVSESASGCYGSIDIPVQTKYRFWDRGPAANRIKVQRKFSFGGTPFTQDFRPYMPSLYPLSDFTTVYHPDASGTTLLTEASASCPFGCQITDWDDSWFATHNPATGTGLIVRMAPTGYDTDLWVDEDLASFTNSTGALLIAPPGGFTGNVNTTTFLCFYDSTIWTPSLTLPPGC